MMKDTYGRLFSVPFAHFDPDSHSLKTFEGTLTSGSMRFCGTVPAQGLMCGGQLFERPMLAPLITGHDCSPLLPTPLSSDWKRGNHPGSLRRRSPELPVVDAHFPVEGGEHLDAGRNTRSSHANGSDDIPTLF